MFFSASIMDFQLPSSSILFTFLVFLLMILRTWKNSKKNHSTSNLPPGPWRLPLIGNMHQLAGPAPHRRLRELAKKYGPFMHLQLGEVSHIVISSPKAATEIMKTHDISFAHRPYHLAASIITYNFSDIGFAPYGEYWRQVRKFATVELLSVKRVKSFGSIREEEISNLITSISASAEAGLPVNLSTMVFKLINSITTRAAFGERFKDQEALLDVIKELATLAGGFSLADVFPSIKLFATLSGMIPELERMHQILDKMLGDIINEHKTSERSGDGEVDDLVDILLKIQDHGELDFPFTANNLKAVILDVFLAGTETSFSTIEWAMSEMLKSPRVMEKAQAEVRQIFDKKGDVDEIGLGEAQYLKLVVKETLRLHPSLPLLLPRECRESCSVNGYDIPLGTKVIVNAWAIARDPDYWTEPDSFIPERFLDSDIGYKGTSSEYIPFGAGRRVCPGISFALASIELSLAKLLYHFDWKLPNGMSHEDFDMTEAFGLTIRRKYDLDVIPLPYHPSNSVLHVE